MDNNLRVLVATDYSTAAQTAERYAISFVKHTGSYLIFMHAYDSSKASEKISREGLRQKKLEDLKAHCHKAIEKAGLKPGELMYETIVLDGPVDQRIKWEAETADASLVFMGTHHAKGLSEKLFGGHTWKMIKKLRIPILAIPENALFKPLEHVVFAAQGREGEISAINFIASFLEKFKADLTGLHVIDYSLADETEDNLFRKFEKNVNEKVKYDKLSFKRTNGKTVTEGLETYCQENTVDWLVMCHEQRTLLERILIPDLSITRKMSFNTNVPLLAVPDYYDPKYADLWKLFKPDAEQLQDEF
ncbi:MAG TPA: universal stress protein [Flavobacteriales bacterium]|nr:universal stress protein [Flavobacteriales bacterium]